jgi:hypothetical protein
VSRDDWGRGTIRVSRDIKGRGTFAGVGLNNYSVEQDSMFLNCNELKSCFCI